MDANPPTLRRSIGLTSLIFYGVGTMVGGGFYALMGKIAGEAGMFVPLAFLGAGLLALVSAFAFAELAARFPVSAGEARYVEEGLGPIWLSTATGLLVVLTGVVSAAALSTATAGFLQDLVPLPHTLGVIAVVILLGTVAAWGIGQSITVVTVITIIEVGALLFVIVTNLDNVAAPTFERTSAAGGFTLLGVFSGAFLGFYAFVGFEDMVNIAEEVKRPRRNLPLAILVSMGITIFLYIAVSSVAIMSIDIERLRESRTPIAELMGQSNVIGRRGIVIISVLTGVNGALVQVIMASRVCYGLASRGRLPGWVARVHARTRTPLYTTAAITAVILALALTLPLTQLAKVTSAIILTVFALVNLSLWRLKGREPAPATEGPCYPRWVPLLGFLSCTGVLTAQLWLVLAH